MAKKAAPRSIDELIEDLEAKPDAYIRTGVLAVDLLTDGLGLPTSGYWHYWGPNGTGKTTLWFNVAKELAKQGLKSLLITVEASNKLVHDMGLDVAPYSNLIKQISPVTYNEAQEVLTAYFDSDFTLAIVDSVSALSTTSVFEGSTEKTVEDFLVAPDAMPRLRLIKWLHATMRRRADKAIALIFHASTNFDRGWYGDLYIPESGQKPQQFSVASSVMEGGKVMNDTVDTSRIIGRDLLIRSPWKNRFSALGGTKKGIPVRIIFGKGVANSYTLLSYCIWKGIVKRSSWSTCNWQGVEDKVQGKAALYAWVKANYTSLIEDFYTNASEYIKALAGGFDHGDI